MYIYEIKPSLLNILKKLSRKDKALHEQVLKKIDEIINSYDVEHYKNLKHEMKDYKEVHVGHFVLVFSFDKKKNLISFEDFDHHDRIFGK